MCFPRWSFLLRCKEFLLGSATADHGWDTGTHELRSDDRGKGPASLLTKLKQ